MDGYGMEGYQMRPMSTAHFLKSRNAVGLWLLAVTLVILAMVVVGGLTRLTGSGLSITEWQPIMGAIPPLNDAQWADAFAKYRHIPQYAAENQGMTLDGFKGIFWWEWSHRFLGRMLGVLFAVPFVWFAATGAIARAAWPRFIVLFALGGLQGLIGWWMVASGLEVRVSVAPYRLAIHLGAAVILLGAMIWTALDYLRGPATTKNDAGKAPPYALGFIALIYCQMLLGALVAGLHAGLIYNTWPDMNGGVFPEDAFYYAPWWRNFFENPGLAQFDHRMVAYAVGALAALVYARAIKLTGMAKKTGKIATVLVVIQIFLGIVTLMLQAPQWLAAAHQIVAALLFCMAVWHAHELRGLQARA
jgi:cytochrome c oxidase assembly protein subunit 15